MSEHSPGPADHDTDEVTHESRMIKAIVRDILIALPLAVIVIFVALLIWTDKPVIDAAATAALPGVLIGIFLGGFAGTARTMD